MASMPMDVATAPDPVNRAQRLATEVADIFAMFRERFGEPSVPQLKVSPIPGTFGQGFPGLIYLSTLAYLNAAERPAIVGDAPMQVFYSDLLHAHEVAHQWWGNRVASNGVGDDWMMEAFANYSALRQLERKKGTKALDSILADYRRHLLQKTEDGQTIESVGPIRLGLRLENSQSPEAWRIITYEKGAWIMHMLRRRLGDANFYALLRQVCVDFEGRTLTTEAFRKLAGKYVPKGMGDQKLEDFFDHWITGTGIPEMELSSKIVGKAPNVKLQLVIKQKKVEETFTTLVPVEIQFAGGKNRVEWIRVDGAETEFELKLPAVPTKVLLDPTNSVLSTKK